MIGTYSGSRSRAPAWSIALSAAVVLLMIAGNSDASHFSGSDTATTYAWSQVSDETSVTNNLSVMAWDPGVGHVVGIVVNASFGFSTYELKGKSWVGFHVWTPQIWTDRRGGVGECQASPYLVYDASDGYLLLLNPYSQCGGGVQLWKFQLDHWTYLAARNAPPESNDNPPGVVYDASDKLVLLYAGDFGSCDCYVDKMFGYHAGTWSQLANIPLEDEFSGGGSSIAPNVVYDPGLGMVVNFGNFGGGGGALRDWTYHSGKWEPLSIQNRLYPLSFVNLVYDPAIPGVLVTGFTSANYYTPPYYTFLWKDGTSGFANVTSLIANSDIGCLGPIFDPELEALICDSGGPPPNYNPPFTLWEFTKSR